MAQQVQTQSSTLTQQPSDDTQSYNPTTAVPLKFNQIAKNRL